MKTIELFSGTKSFSKVMGEHGHQTLTIDLEAVFEPDIIGDILELPDTIAKGRDIAWFSPPCQGFSVAAIGHNWTGGYRGYEPKSDSARLSIALAKKTIAIIEESKPTWWFIENPRGLLRKMRWMEEFLKRTGGVRHTVSYCQYGDTRQKPTDIWTNALWWTPRDICKPGSSCHESAPRGSRTGTQGLGNATERGRIPAAIFEEILSQYERA